MSVKLVRVQDEPSVDGLISSVHPDRISEWLPGISNELGGRILKNRRLSPLLAQILTRHYHLDGEESDAASADIAIATLPKPSLLRLIAISGLIWHAKYLRTIIQKQELIQVLEGIDEDCYRIAMANFDAAPSDGESQDNVERLASSGILVDGQACFLAWMQSLPVNLKSRILVKFPPGFENEPIAASIAAKGPAIVKRAGEALISHVNR